MSDTDVVYYSEDGLRVINDGHVHWPVEIQSEDNDDLALTAEQAFQVGSALIDASGKSQPNGTRKTARDLPLNEALIRLALIHDIPVEFNYTKVNGTTQYYVVNPETV